MVSWIWWFAAFPASPWHSSATACWDMGCKQSALHSQLMPQGQIFTALGDAQLCLALLSCAGRQYFVIQNFQKLTKLKFGEDNLESCGSSLKGDITLCLSVSA